MSERVRVRDPLTGAQVSITCSDRHAAAHVREEARRLRRDHAQGLMDDVDVHARMRKLRGLPMHPLVSDVLEGYASTLGPTSSRNVRMLARGALSSLARMQVRSLIGVTMGAWLARCRGAGYAESTIRTAWLALHAAVRAAVAGGTLAREPWGGWRPPKLARAAQRARECCRTRAELDMLLAAADCYDKDRRAAGWFSATRATIVILARMGLRSGEAAALRWSDIGAGTSMRVERTCLGFGGKLGPVKGRRPHVLAIPGDVAGELALHRQYLADLGCDVERGPVFPAPDLGSRDGSVVLNTATLREIVRAARLPRPDAWTTTSLRDTHSTLAARELGGDLGAWLETTRHASLSAAQRYLVPPRKPPEMN